MNDKKVFIHIGPPKTGTSAIQNYCNAHRKLLESQGILYPEHSIDANGISSGNLYSVFDQTASGELAVNTQKVKELMKAFHDSDTNILLLSSEFFFHRLGDIKVHFKDATFIAYVRSPIDYFESSYNQTIKRHGNTKPIKIANDLKFNILNQLEIWVEKFGSEKFLMRAYAKSLFPDGDIITDFLSIFGVEKSHRYVHSYINPSYSFEALEFKRWLNQFDLEDTTQIIDFILQSFEGSENRFSLIPPRDFQRYKVQVIEYLKALSVRQKVSNIEGLIEVVGEGVQNRFVEQSLTFKQFDSVRKCIFTNSESLYVRLCQLLYKQSYLPAFDSEYVRWFLQGYNLTSVGKNRSIFRMLFSKGSLSLKKQYFLEYIKQKFGRKKPSVWGESDSCVKGLTELRSNLNLSRDIDDASLLVEVSKLSENNGNIEFAFYLVDEAVKLSPEKKFLKKRLAFLERRLAEQLNLKISGKRSNQRGGQE